MPYGYVMKTTWVCMHVCVKLCVCVCLPLPIASNQSFCMQITGYEMGGGDPFTLLSWFALNLLNLRLDDCFSSKLETSSDYYTHSSFRQLNEYCQCYVHSVIGSSYES